MKNFIFSILVLFPTLSQAQVNWEDEYKKLCAYDHKWCGRLKYDDGTWMKPKPEIVKLLKELKPMIAASAAKLGVSPLAIAGSIMAENSLNVSVSDDVQDLLVRIGVANKGEILGKKFTFGLGQLNFDAAREAENHVAAIEKRAPLKDDELTDALLVPEKAIYYVAAVLRKVQDDYKKNGIDISKQPEILTSLYNLGKSETRAKEAKASHSTPRMNYFGFFVKKNLGSLSFLNAPTAPKAVVASPAKASSGVKVASAPSIVEIPKVLTIAFNKNMALYSSPPTCEIDSEYGGTNLEEKYKSMKSYPVTTVGSQGSTFTVIAPTIDCESNNWKLLKLQNGDIGWIKEDDLTAGSSKMYLPAVKCKTTPEALKCAESVKKAMKDYVLEDPNKGLVFLKPYSKGKADFSEADWECEDRTQTNLLQTAVAAAAAPAVPVNKVQSILNSYKQLKFKEVPKYSLDELKNTLATFEGKVKSIEAFYQSPISDVTNPYTATSLAKTVLDYKSCLSLQEIKLAACNSYSLEKVAKLIDSLPSDTKLKPLDIAWVNFNMKDLATPSPFLSKDEYLQARTANKLNAYQKGYERSTVHVQYLASELDLKTWNMEELESTFKACIVATDEIIAGLNANPGSSSADKSRILNAIKHSGMVTSLQLLDLIREQKTDDGKEIWKTAQPLLIQAAKACIGYSESFGVKVKNLKSIPDEYACLYTDLSVVEGRYNNIISKDLLNHMLLTGDGVHEYLDDIERTYVKSIFGELSKVFEEQKNGVQVSQAKADDEDQEEIDASYCPNKTAEMIEELLENQGCVKHVYVPDEWLLNRLNGLGSKIIKRPFETKDRFAVDFGALSCK